MSSSWLQIAGDAIKIPGLLVEVYGDLARPGVRQVGKALETVIGLGNTLLWPVAWANERSRMALERNLEKYRKALESVPEEKIVPVAPEIGVPVAEKLEYIREERLADLYVNLLASASNVDLISFAHPSFVNVINNLSPDEALLLEFFKNATELSFVQPKAVIQGTGSYTNIEGVIVQAETVASLAFPQNVSAYLENLSGLGLVRVLDDKWLVDSPVYAQLEALHRPSIAAVLATVPHLKDRDLQFGKGIVQRTSFGANFINACHTR
jgi:hypothetical protein